jgi:uncharacterized protein YcbK (DUF882 family)
MLWDNKMKIKVYKHNSIKANIDDDFPKVINYFNSSFVKQYINEQITFDIENTTISIDIPTKFFLPNDGKYDAVMFVYEKGLLPIYAQAFPFSNTLRGIWLSSNVVEDNIDYTWKAMSHEILHAICYKIMSDKKVFIPNVLDTYYKNDDPYAVDGNFAKQLQALKPYYKKYLYFSDSEVVGLKPELVQKLDIMRGQCGFPFIINSGFRTVAQNATLPDAVQDSAHTLGEAVDLKCLTSDKRFKLIKVALENGINRLGCGDNFVHLDISKTLPQNVMWKY